MYRALRESRAMKKINKFLYSPLIIVIFGILTLAAFVFSKELAFYSLVVIYALWVIAFCDDLTPIMPLFMLCYVTASAANNPGRTEGGLFYGASGSFMICLAVIAVIALAARITLDVDIGWRKLFGKRRTLLSGMLALGAVYLISGIGSKFYAEYAQRNIVFALIQLAGIFLLYFVFSATVKWEKFNIDYFACAGLVVGLVVLAELGWLYLTNDILSGGAVDRERIYTGWGMYNNIGAIIATAIPFAFYFACKKKHNSVYLILALILALGVVLSCSRSSMLFAALVTIISYVYTFVKTENKKEFGIASALLAAIFSVGVAVFWDKVMDIFKNVPSIADIVDGDLVFNDSGRFDIYKEGIETFLKNPVIGQGFYCHDYDLYDFSIVESFSSFFPPRWHNTVIQLLASCGIVGLLAYSYHRYQTIRLFVKRRTVENTYIGLYIFVLLCMSLLDCHFFNVGPVLFYSMALAVAEYAENDVNSVNYKEITRKLLT